MTYIQYIYIYNIYKYIQYKYIYIYAINFHLDPYESSPAPGGTPALLDLLTGVELSSGAPNSHGLVNDNDG